MSITIEVIHGGHMSRLTSKGQVTLPKELRDELGLKPGAEVTFKKMGDHYVILKGDNDSYLKDWTGKLGPLPDGQTVDDLINDIRGGLPNDRR